MQDGTGDIRVIGRNLAPALVSRIGSDPYQTNLGRTKRFDTFYYHRKVLFIALIDNPGPFIRFEIPRPGFILVF